MENALDAARSGDNRRRGVSTWQTFDHRRYAPQVSRLLTLTTVVSTLAGCVSSRPAVAPPATPARSAVIALDRVRIGGSDDVVTLGAALDSPEHHVTNGLKLMAGDKMEAAMRDLNRAAELDPNYSRAYFHMGMVYKVAHNWDRAIHYFQKVLNLKNGYEDEARREYDLIRQLQSQSGS